MDPAPWSRALGLKFGKLFSNQLPALELLAFEVASQAVAVVRRVHKITGNIAHKHVLPTTPVFCSVQSFVFEDLNLLHEMKYHN